ncbi:hypothetical protein HNY73_010968 [Argiope bruennichi]|uniref:Uncharacterized protein n=1 Tax=Argiope bruennichi TaxID=94029 RepID=A0A8T0F8W1_ARGBR|nr:hypothetical protein HNY73_010968 [Argiope bruennichi]
MEFSSPSPTTYMENQSPDIIPRGRVPIIPALVPFSRSYDMHGLQWDYSFTPGHHTGDKWKPRKLKSIDLPYQSLELLLETTEYNESVDVWSVKCIFAQLLLKRQLFPRNETGNVLEGWSFHPSPTTYLEDQSPDIIPRGRVPGYTPRHWVPISVASYDMHGLQWDYSFTPGQHTGDK